MTPAARIQAVVEILDALEATQKPADRFLRDWFRARRYAGSKDRAAVAERVFAIFRHRASLGWRMQSAQPRALAIASLEREGTEFDEIEALFSGEGYAPARLTADERQALAAAGREDAPAHVLGEFPEFLAAELSRAFGEEVISEMRAFAERASIDLRVNSLKTSRENVQTQLRDDRFDSAFTPFAPSGLRIASGAGSSRLSRHPLHESGAFEFQDESAQIASCLCAAKPGETILDLAAGAGGKSLALAADMENKGRIVACDVREGALSELVLRARRAGASIVSAHLLGAPPPETFDAVLVDAPCSGSGTWRRQPELKWRLTPSRLEELNRIQDGLLESAAQRVRDGGRLIYATCSILPCENEDRAARFLDTHKSFSVQPARDVWQSMAAQLPQGMERFFHATPLKTGTDGFFTAIFVRKRPDVAAP